MRLISLLFHDIYDRDPAESGFRGPGANRYKLQVAAFDQQLAHVARARLDQPVLLTTPFDETGDAMPFALTFDDGGISHYTVAAGRLESRGWRGHFFVTTGMIGRRGFLDSRQIRELRSHGHVIGTHSMSHPGRFARSGWQAMVHEWRESRKMLSDLLGEEIIIGCNGAVIFGGRHRLQAGFLHEGVEIGVIIGLRQFRWQHRHRFEIGDAGALLGCENLLRLR